MPTAGYLVIAGDLRRGDSLCAFLNTQGHHAIVVPLAVAMRNGIFKPTAKFFLLDSPPSIASAQSMCQKLRAVSRAPMIVICGRDDVEERIAALDAGADDAVIRPFNRRELLSRIRALRRRSSIDALDAQAQRFVVCKFGDWHLELASQKLHHSDGSMQPLKVSEFQLLEAFVTHPMQLLTRERLQEILYGHTWSAMSRLIDARICRLRRQLRDSDSRRADPLIKSVYGQGYMFTCQVEEVDVGRSIGSSR